MGNLSAIVAIGSTGSGVDEFPDWEYHVIYFLSSEEENELAPGWSERAVKWCLKLALWWARPLHLLQTETVKLVCRITCSAFWTLSVWIEVVSHSERQQLFGLL